MSLAKTPSQSRAEMAQIVLPGVSNASGRLFGGQLMGWIDLIAAVAARRHSGHEVTTAAVDKLTFEAGAELGSTILLVAEPTYAGRTSMEIRVDTFREDLDGTRHRINRAYLVMVALDEKGHPTPVPPLAPETEAEKAEWAAADARRKARQAGR